MDEHTLSPQGFGLLTPIRIGAVALAVRDLDRTVAFYRDVIGLDLIRREPARAELGAGGTAMLTLEHRPGARPDDRRTAGLFHTAFLMPTRTDLARFVRHLAERKTPLSGMADHEVSEAIYLDDPEGNGVEVYADRAAAGWRRVGATIAITNEALDIDDLMSQAEGQPPYEGAPVELAIGHVHLRVGNVDEAVRFYGDVVGFDVTARMAGAAFLSSGGYHHHLATNQWRSAGAGRRDPDCAGLIWVSLDVTADARAAVKQRLGDAGLTPAQFEDPWGTSLRVASL